MTRFVGRISLLNDFGRTLAAVFVTSVVVYGLLPAETEPDLTSAIYWNIWATTYLGLTWFLILQSSPEQTRRWASNQRPLPRSRFSLLRSALLRVLQVLFFVGRTSSLLFIVLISLTGLSLAVSLLPQVRDIQTAQGLVEAVLNTLGVITAWGVLHTSYSLYYASRYFQSEESSSGLAFPGDQDLRLLDFAYFAFTIGTSFAVSDVEVTNSRMRRSVLGHQILAFFYNAAILSLTINLVVDL
ncbi:MAG: DUF1345 domain-containing protein [Actinomycetota bacterium]|nr:DUF1345 domain-containing protein [Actinomycetota bacterium]